MIAVQADSITKETTSSINTSRCQAMLKPTYPVSLGVIIPAYNEIFTVREIIRRVYDALDDKFTRLQVIVVDDGSTDGTKDELVSIAADNPKIELHRHEINRGKGASIRTALEHIDTDLVIIQDADLEYDPNDIPSLVKPLLAGEADIIIGSRVLPPYSVLSFKCRGEARSYRPRLVK